MTKPIKEESLVKTINKYTVQTINQIKTIPETQLIRIISGQLRSCIDAHGPITAEHIGSAAKRITNHLLKS
jgi:hypothetical protein